MWADLTDAALCILSQGGDDRATDRLARRYERIATGAATAYFIPGCERDDVRQEARLGLLTAIATFQPARGVPFEPFARMCVNAHLITALKHARRFKRMVLDEAVRIGVSENGYPIEIADLLPSPLSRDPYVIAADKEHLGRLLRRMKSLSPFERRSVIGLANGLTYAQISAAGDGENMKAIDNAVQRARRKLREAA